ncbi:integrase [Chelatococcus reniformis]|uniref:Tyr recombinase domain-containing protein n=1 Tax=Chelatococcus reniformis TaxID=1494448 RepID=A0A916XP03_9HYPH|nr:integrase [Chelatococcus reniformis]GGC90836.1 hypothetical protein GCM10010994_55790 [Chelatococcus reniformis]
MVELPRYVRPQRKPNGRVFFYYERYRNTVHAWPRLRLPDHPEEPVFWARCRQCERLDAVRDATWSWFYVAESGRRYELPGPGDGDTFWAAIDRADESDRKLEAGERKTFRALIEEYRGSNAFKKLSDSSKGDYDRYLGHIMSVWADDPVSDLMPEIAQSAIDTYEDAPSSGRYFRSVLSKLVAYGVPRGYAASNVVQHTEKPDHTPVPYEPWPDWAFEIFFEFARPDLHLPALSALYTGQRKVDVVPMLRPKSTDPAIELIARKTGAKVWVPIHGDYRQLITAAKADHVNLHLREDGEAWTYEGFSTIWQREMTFGIANEGASAVTAAKAARDAQLSPQKTAAMRRLRDAKLVFHGLRKNAVCNLLEVGCTEAETASIVEMSEQMVRHYSKSVDKRRLATNAMKKLEAAWSHLRPLGTRNSS